MTGCREQLSQNHSKPERRELLHPLRNLLVEVSTHSLGGDSRDALGGAQSLPFVTAAAWTTASLEA